MNVQFRLRKFELWVHALDWVSNKQKNTEQSLEEKMNGRLGFAHLSL